MHTARKENTKADPAPQVPGWKLLHVTQGDCTLTSNPGEALTTILGSCISACMRDPRTGLGGMNHFLLPIDTRVGEGFGVSLRYGVNAMEALMNAVTSRAGIDRRDIEIKVFGGANVQASLGPVGFRNADFVEEFLRNEGLRPAAKHLRGTLARKIIFHPATGKVLMRYAQKLDQGRLASEEMRAASRVAVKPVDDDIELFG